MQKREEINLTGAGVGLSSGKKGTISFSVEEIRRTKRRQMSFQQQKIKDY
jgi:hypothetical protein